MPDKLNNVDYRWYLVRTRPGHESELCARIEREKERLRNILEAYCPTHTRVRVRRGDNERRLPLFDGYVFVLATQGALAGFLRDAGSDARIRYNRRRAPEEKASPCTIPEPQMRAFRDYNENYADKVIVLERPYTDYAFNAKTDEPNEIVRVIDGPLAGCEGYVCRFRRKKGLVFRVQGATPGSRLTVIYPNVSDLRVVRLHNAGGDRLSVGTEKGRAVDLLVGILQACGYGESAQAMLYGLMERLAANPSLTALRKELQRQGEQELALRLARLTGREAELLINLARHEHDTPGYVRENWPRLILRPFLTPTSGTEMEESENEVEIRHRDFTETIRRTELTEEAYFPDRQESGRITATYYAHIGMTEDGEGVTCFANWDGFLREYFLTAGKANEKLVAGKARTVRDEASDTERERLVESFRNHAPTLYEVLTDTDSAVKAVRDFKVGEDTLNVMAIRTPVREKEAVKERLIKTCVRICVEINTTGHLAVWRRYLRAVWLHQ